MNLLRVGVFSNTVPFSLFLHLFQPAITKGKFHLYFYSITAKLCFSLLLRYWMLFPRNSDDTNTFENITC